MLPDSLVLSFQCSLTIIYIKKRQKKPIGSFKNEQSMEQATLSTLGGEVWVYKSSLTPSHFNEEPVRSQESGGSCICVLVVSISLLSTIFLFYFVYGF